MRKSADSCIRMVCCNGELRKVQQKYKGKYYLGLRCSKCKNIVFEIPTLNSSSPWEDVLKVTDISVKVMKGVEKLSRRL